jgi:hypothetical protein
LLLAFEHLPAARKSEAYECLRVLSQGMPVSWADILRWDLQPSALAALMLHAILAVAAERGVLTRPQLRRYARQRRGIAGSAAACKRMRDPQATCAAVLAEPGLPDLLGAAGVAALSRSDTRLSELRGMLNILIEESRSSAAIRLFATAPGAPQATSA